MKCDFYMSKIVNVKNRSDSICYYCVNLEFELRRQKSFCRSQCFRNYKKRHFKALSKLHKENNVN